VVNDAFELKGLITVKDITKQLNFPNAARDDTGRLRVGAAVGVGEGTEERVEAWSKPAWTPSWWTPHTATAGA
jgi:IMP dehydrogenase